MAKGRDKELIKLRDEALCRRYYYWTERQRLRFDDALKILSEREFFISEERIMAIIRRMIRTGTLKIYHRSPRSRNRVLPTTSYHCFPSYRDCPELSLMVNAYVVSNTLTYPGRA